MTAQWTAQSYDRYGPVREHRMDGLALKVWRILGERKEANAFIAEVLPACKRYGALVQFVDSLGDAQTLRAIYANVAKSAEALAGALSELPPRGRPGLGEMTDQFHPWFNDEHPPFEALPRELVMIAHNARDLSTQLGKAHNSRHGGPSKSTHLRDELVREITAAYQRHFGKQTDDLMWFASDRRLLAIINVALFEAGTRKITTTRLFAKILRTG